jgi:anti-sigma factor RsiW
VGDILDLQGVTMASLIHELENNEAMLMMFLTGELPAEDQLEVEHMLASDAGLRAELERIKTAYEGAMGALAKLDADHSALPAENHAIRQAMRAMKQWQVDRLSRQPMIITPARIKFPVWAYPVAGVAALLIGTIAWWGFGGQFMGRGSSDGTTTGGVAGDVAVVTPSSEDTTAKRLDDSFQGDAPTTEQPNAMAEAEIQASSLADRSDSSWVASPLFLTEANP